MQSVRRFISAWAGAAGPSRDEVRLRISIPLDVLVTLAVIAAAVGLAAAFQVLGRMGRGGAPGRG